MGRACAQCGGTGFGSVGPDGYVDDGVPCRTCNPSADPKEPGSFAPKKAMNATVAFVDGPPDHPVDPSDQGAPAEAFFSGDQIARQRAEDQAKEAAMGHEGRR
jgi:hypothetical protein